MDDSIAAGGVAEDLHTRLDAMREAQQKSTVMKAVSSLNAYKTFRAQNEKKYTERSIEEQRRQEIMKPLEDALLENKLLLGQMKRREDIIRTLRRNLTMASLNSKLHIDKPLDQGLDRHEDVSLKLLAIGDECEALKAIIEKMKTENERLHRKLKFEQDSRREFIAKFEVREMEFREYVKAQKKDREGFSHTALMKENTTERIIRDYERVSKDLNESKQIVLEKTFALESMTDELFQIREDNIRLQQQYDTGNEMLMQIQSNAEEREEKLYELEYDKAAVTVRYVVFSRVLIYIFSTFLFIMSSSTLVHDCMTQNQLREAQACTRSNGVRWIFHPRGQRRRLRRQLCAASSQRRQKRKSAGRRQSNEVPHWSSVVF